MNYKRDDAIGCLLALIILSVILSIITSPFFLAIAGAAVLYSLIKRLIIIAKYRRDNGGTYGYDYDGDLYKNDRPSASTDADDFGKGNASNNEFESSGDSPGEYSVDVIDVDDVEVIKEDEMN